MEEAYEAALQRVGGQDAAKPKAVHELLALQFPHLTMQVGGAPGGGTAGLAAWVRARPAAGPRVSARACPVADTSALVPH